MRKPGIAHELRGTDINQSLKEKQVWKAWGSLGGVLLSASFWGQFWTQNPRLDACQGNKRPPTEPPTPAPEPALEKDPPGNREAFRMTNLGSTGTGPSRSSVTPQEFAFSSGVSKGTTKLSIGFKV